MEQEVWKLVVRVEGEDVGGGRRRGTKKTLNYDNLTREYGTKSSREGGKKQLYVKRLFEE